MRDIVIEFSEIINVPCYNGVFETQAREVVIYGWHEYKFHMHRTLDENGNIHNNAICPLTITESTSGMQVASNDTEKSLMAWFEKRMNSYTKEKFSEEVREHIAHNEKRYALLADPFYVAVEETGLMLDDDEVDELRQSLKKHNLLK